MVDRYVTEWIIKIYRRSLACVLICKIPQNDPYGTYDLRLYVNCPANCQSLMPSLKARLFRRERGTQPLPAAPIIPLLPGMIPRKKT